MNSFFKDMWERKHLIPLFAVFMLLYAASYFQRVAVPGTIFDRLQIDGLTGVQIAGLGASFTYTYAFFQLVIGILADKYNGTRVILVGGQFFCIGVLLFPITDKLPQMYLCRILTAIGASSLYLSLLKEIDRVFGRKNYAVLVGLNYYIGYAGGLFASMPFGYICKWANSWKNPLLIIGVISVVLYGQVIVESRRMQLPPITNAKLSLKPLLLLLKRKYTWYAMYCQMVVFGCYFTIQTVFGVKFLKDFLKMSDTNATLTIFVITLTTMTTMLAIGIISSIIKNRRKPIFMLSGFFVFFSTVLMFFSVKNHFPTPFFIAGYIFYAFSSGLALSYVFSLQELNSRDTLAQSASLTNMAGYLGSAISQPLIGLLLDSFVDRSTQAVGKAIIYPDKAYLVLFSCLLIPTAICFIISFLIPETRGHYLNQHILKK